MQSILEQAMTPFNAENVRRNVRAATTEELLDRVTAYRDGMEPEALEIIEMELHRRAVSQEQVDKARRDYEASAVRDSSGVTLRCSFCKRPAIARGWGWHRLWKVLPLFPRLMNFCAKHHPK
jgi:hypothetical protein